MIGIDPAAPKDAAARRAHFLKSAEQLRQDMEALSLDVRDLVLAQPPVQLLGYVLSLFQMANMSTFDEEHGPDREVLKTFQFALEYLHAVWSSNSPLADESIALDEAGAEERAFQLDSVPEIVGAGPDADEGLAE